MLAVDPADGLDLPRGTAWSDHLDARDRWDLHERIGSLAAAATAPFEEAMTVNGLRLAWLWELDVARAVGGVASQARALARAARASGARVLASAHPDPRTVAVVRAVAAALDLETELPRTVTPPAPPAPPAPAGLRRRVVAAARRAGAPSRLRRGSVVFLSYWPLVPVIDRMIAERGRRPAVLLARPPQGPGRAIRAALQGGWVGTPGPRARSQARAATEAVLARLAQIPAPEVRDEGIDLGPAMAAELTKIVRRRGTAELADAAVLRRALRGGRPSAVLAAWDGEAAGRLLVHLAREAGIRTLVLSHGAYLLPQDVADMDVCDEPLVWTHAVAPPLTPRGRTVREVGYPVPHGPVPATRSAPARERRVLVLGQPPLRGTPLDEARVTMRQYATAIEAVAAHAPGATVVLRPHPAEGPQAAARALRHAAGAPVTVEIDATTPIAGLHASCHLCVGTVTTASLQAVLAGTPLVALNLLGFPWSWPLGGDTPVPLATDAGELDAWVARWAAGEVLPGRDALLEALGADPAGGDPAGRLLEILDAGG